MAAFSGDPRSLPAIGTVARDWNVGRGCIWMSDEFTMLPIVGTGTTQAEWRATGTNVASSNITLLSADGGQLSIATATASGDEAFLQSQGAPFIWEPITASVPIARRMVFECRAKIDAITTSTSVMGMFAAGTTDPLDSQGNGFGFATSNGTLQYLVKSAAGTTAVTSIGATVVADRFYTYRIEWDGGMLHFYRDGVELLATSTNVTAAALQLAPVMGVETATGAARTLIVDSIAVGVEAPRS